MGWIEIPEQEQKQIREAQVHARIDSEKVIANTALSAPQLTVGEKIAWNDYLRALDSVCLCADFDCDPKFPIRPDA